MKSAKKEYKLTRSQISGHLVDRTYLQSRFLQFYNKFQKIILNQSKTVFSGIHRCNLQYALGIIDIILLKHLYFSPNSMWRRQINQVCSLHHDQLMVVPFWKVHTTTIKWIITTSCLQLVESSFNFYYSYVNFDENLSHNCRWSFIINPHSSFGRGDVRHLETLNLLTWTHPNTNISPISNVKAFRTGTFFKIGHINLD